MTIGNFTSSLADVEKLLLHLNLLRQKGIKSINIDEVSDEFKISSQKQDYFNVYKIALKNFDYDFLLSDQSFFQFEFKINSTFKKIPDIRYAFFQNPQEYKTYIEYLELIREKGLIDESNQEIGDLYSEEYEQFLIEQQVGLANTSIRFDVDRPNYRPLIHSVAHIHIGHLNDIRIPLDKILTPLKFVLFILKQTNYPLWKKLIDEEDIEITKLLNISKKSCAKLDSSIWIDSEKREMFLT